MLGEPLLIDVVQLLREPVYLAEIPHPLDVEEDTEHLGYAVAEVARPDRSLFAYLTWDPWTATSLVTPKQTCIR